MVITSLSAEASVLGQQRVQPHRARVPLQRGEQRGAVVVALGHQRKQTARAHGSMVRVQNARSHQLRAATRTFSITAAAVSATARTAAPTPNRIQPPGQSGPQDADSSVRSAKEQRREAERQRKVAQVRHDAESAEQQAHDREDELRQAESAQEQAEKQLQAAEARSAALAEEVKSAQEQRRQARSALDQAPARPVGCRPQGPRSTKRRQNRARPRQTHRGREVIDVILGPQGHANPSLKRASNC